MTAFSDLERGDIVWGLDPLSEKGRPMLVLATPHFPSHGVQLITALVSSKTYHSDSLVLRDRDYDGSPLGKRSHVLPWSLVTLASAAAVDYRMTSLHGTRTDDVRTQTITYLSS